jgi:two-component system osmolarity sensor histidine kinase EnvZ
METPAEKARKKTPLKDLLRRLRVDVAFFHWLKRYLPRGLYGRALLILVVPVILAQAVATYVFYERHWQIVTNRLAFALAGEVAVITEKMEGGDPEKIIREIGNVSERNLYLSLSYQPGRTIGDYPMRGNYSSILGRMLLKALDEKVVRPYALDLRYDKEWIAIHVGLPKGVLTVISPERRVYTPTAGIFIIWMIGTSILLSLIAILFLRNQIRPISRLAMAAERIGKGQDTPGFKPEGAREVRQAAVNLIIMRDRLRRQIAQRTAMLNGVSHDLRTPLTRMKLQLEMMPDSPAITELKADVTEMTQMVDAYLSFARGEDADENISMDIAELLEETVHAARRGALPVHETAFIPQPIAMRATAMKRAISNLINNAARYGTEVWISTYKGRNFYDIMIDDNGPGIPAERREDVFRPFTRLEESRNSETGGIGLGLTIARDIAHQHGGDVLLGNSPKGGLRATLRLPL